MATDPAPEGDRRPDGFVETLEHIIIHRLLGVEVVGSRLHRDGGPAPGLVLTLCLQLLGPPHVLYMDVLVVAMVGPPQDATTAQDEESSDSY